MGLLELASGNSLWRGYDYFEEKKVLAYRQTNDGCYEGEVSGSRKKPYTVAINLAHPRTSNCDCPHANGKRVICKHMVAVYFTVFPAEAKRFYEEAMEAEKKEEARQENLGKKLISCVSKMKKSEIQEELLRILYEGPEWQFDRYLKEHWIE